MLENIEVDDLISEILTTGTAIAPEQAGKLDEFIKCALGLTVFETLETTPLVSKCVHLSSNIEAGSEVFIGTWHDGEKERKGLIGAWNPQGSNKGPGNTVIRITNKQRRKVYVWLDSMARIVQVKWNIDDNRSSILVPYTEIQHAN